MLLRISSILSLHFPIADSSCPGTTVPSEAVHFWFVFSPLYLTSLGMTSGIRDRVVELALLNITTDKKVVRNNSCKPPPFAFDWLSCGPFVKKCCCDHVPTRIYFLPSFLQTKSAFCCIPQPSLFEDVVVFCHFPS